MVGVVYAVELLALAAVAVPVLVKQWLALRGGGADGYVTHPSILGYAVVYLAVMTVLWVSAQPVVRRNLPWHCSREHNRCLDGYRIRPKRWNRSAGAHNSEPSRRILEPV
ncbi:Uncharacterised protein [Mycobacteroides abscessus subsp. abscessus]|nr:Uncharacterised protein [Mycobacteroides abscessus subsp. abscessus]